MAPPDIMCIIWYDAGSTDPTRTIYCPHENRSILLSDCPGFNDRLCEHSSKFINVKYYRVDSKGNIIDKYRNEVHPRCGSPN